MTLNLDLNSGRNVEQTRNEIIQLVQMDMRSDLNNLMDQLCKGDEIIRIDRLELNLGKVQYDQFGKIFKEQLFNGLYKAISDARQEVSDAEFATNANGEFKASLLNGNRGKNTSIGFYYLPPGIEQTNDQQLNTLVYFLENGVLPWWNAFEGDNDIHQFVRNEIVGTGESNTSPQKRQFYQTYLQRYIALSKRGQKRLVTWLRPEMLEKLLDNWFPKELKTLKGVRKWLKVLIEMASPSETWSAKMEQKMMLTFFSVLTQNARIKRSNITSQNLLVAFTRTFWLESSTSVALGKTKTWWHEKLLAIVSSETELKRLIAVTSQQKTKEWIAELIGEMEKSQPNISKTVPEKNLDQKEVKKDEVPPKIADKLEPEEQTLEAITFDYAGMVILWPMFSTLFKNRELTVDNAFVDEKAQFKALQLLNYMACGESNLDEYQMPLNKLICGIPLQAIAEFETPLSEADKTEVTALMEHVIKSWPVLKNTSPEGLRSGFLMRKGELNEQNEYWFLKVEESAVDILLRKLPWGYHMIKLPWMPKLIQIEW